MREFRQLHPELPIFCDPSHIAGDTELLPEVIREASLQEYDGLMIEVHPEPKHALTDARQQISPSHLPALLEAWHDAPSGGTTPLYDLRQHLRVVDDELIRLIAERERLSHLIGEWKQENGMQSYQSIQNELMELERETFARQHGADTTLIRELFHLIHKDSVAIQDRIISADTAR